MERGFLGAQDVDERIVLTPGLRYTGHNNDGPIRFVSA